MDVDYLVIGAGPAGLQLGYFLGKAGREYVILEAGATPGTFYRTYPRHRRMISINKPHTGWSDPELALRMDWNSLLSDDPELLFTRYTERYFPDAGDYVRYLIDFAKAHRLPVVHDCPVERIEREDGGFTVHASGGRVFRARRVVVATGFGRPYLPPLPGIETTELYGEVSVDPDDFTDQRVLIIGKGNSAFETADNLVEKAAVIHLAGPESIKFAWRTHFIGHLRAVNNNFLDTYQLKTQNMVLDATIQDIERRDGEYLVTMAYARRDKVVRLAYDRVITCTGFAMDGSIFGRTCRPQTAIHGRFPALTHEWESVNVPGLYFAGTLTQVRDFKKYTSAFIHGFRHGILALTRVLDQKYEGVPWPAAQLPAEAGAVTDAVLARLNRSSALWSQYTFLCDLIVPGPGGTVGYLEEVPVDYARARGDRSCFAVTLEYGAGHDAIDPFDVTVGRAWEADPGHEDRYMHPVIRHYRNGEQVAALHLAEDIYNDWTSEDEHRAPLRSFLDHFLVKATACRPAKAART
ncbi:pyridine nucleotide-disulfide oxidoreductase [Spongiactinospora gelatinilytica]|uniref:Pyridine nucleotide-disulfide oxidoreductase n=1 Tax=Spongiactinospora gelatinilytica TaxID=2666298 RepID=A0A2W2GI60_9ACTN|nr:NAD(P)-binding domain-containing protein [Spongiactinospora gelatinilytica]PZG47552.1 pyridine nucleotide-disulfide oxidoreductase [Spongiactinospora gelatinilytica]